jgi:Raf kinase inhibitor-like YbhB/YbcL family protein
MTGEPLPAVARSAGSRPVAVVWLLAAGFVASCAAGTGSARPSVASSGGLATPRAPGSPSAAPPTSGSPSTTAATSGTATPAPASASPSAAAGPFRLTAEAFAAGKAIPREYTCDGSNVSPALAWSGAPAGTAALVLLVDDPDARDFVHWIVLDLPGAPAGTLPRGIAGDAATPQQGRNDFGRFGWGGPCPPSGTHRYRFTLAALVAPLGLAGHPDGRAVRSALGKTTVLGRAALEGTYRRS